MESRATNQSASEPKIAVQEDSHGPFWQTPTRYGAAEAVISMGTIAAPLLAGFSLAAFIQVLGLSAGDVRYRDLPALLLLLAAALLVLAVQATFWARQYQVTPAELRDWWPDADQQSRLDMLKVEQASHMAKFKIWSRRARIAFDLGLLCLLAALAVLAVPPGPGSAPVRWAAVGVGALAFMLELAWVVGSFITGRPNARKLSSPIWRKLPPMALSDVLESFVVDCRHSLLRQLPLRAGADRDDLVRVHALVRLLAAPSTLDARYLSLLTLTAYASPHARRSASTARSWPASNTPRCRPAALLSAVLPI